MSFYITSQFATADIIKQITNPTKEEKKLVLNIVTNFMKKKKKIFFYIYSKLYKIYLVNELSRYIKNIKTVQTNLNDIDW